MTESDKIKCVPCEGLTEKMSADQSSKRLNKLQGWNIVDNHHLQRKFTFPDFVLALSFVNRVGELAEREGHHPDILLTWGKVQIEIFTHSVNGLTENDFILAEEIDSLSQ